MKLLFDIKSEERKIVRVFISDATGLCKEP